MRILYTLSVLFLSSIGFAQHCNCDAFLLPNNRKVFIYSDSSKSSEVLFSIKNDSIKENYFNLFIHQFKDNMFLVTPSDMTNKKYKKGWISIGNVGIYSNNYSKKLKLYSKPDKNKGVENVFDDYINIPLNVLKCKDKWLFVSFVLNKKKYEGWLSPDSQCANVFTTCN
jgi:hypothetical protein